MKDNLKEEPVVIWTGSAMLEGGLAPHPQADALLLVASPGASALKSGHRLIANHLAHHGFAVLFADVLTEDEQQIDSRTGHFRFDIPFLSSRLSGIVEWVGRDRSLRGLPIAFLGSGAVAAAALKIAGGPRDPFAALILAEARTDLVTASLQSVHTPTMLIVPEGDLAILRMNREAIDALSGEKRLEVLPDTVRTIDDEMNAELLARMTLGWTAHVLQPVTA